MLKLDRYIMNLKTDGITFIIYAIIFSILFCFCFMFFFLDFISFYKIFLLCFSFFSGIKIKNK